MKAVKLELGKQNVTNEVECEEKVAWGDPATGGRAHFHAWEKQWWHGRSASTG
jgi:hypothetical protein